ncbi:MAG: TonB-dependent receptor [Pseudomonadales bacterium]
MLWNIDDRGDLRIIADYADADEQCCDAVILGESPLVAGGAFAAAGLPTDGGAPASGRSALNNRRSNAQQFENPFEQWGISAELNYDFDAFELTYIGSYRYFDAQSVQHSDFIGLDLFSVRPEAANGQKTFDEIETTTHELRFAGENGRLQWMVGGFFMWEDIVEGQGLGLGADFSRNTSANAFFGLPLLGPGFDLGLQALAGVPLATGGTFGDALSAADPALVFTGGVDPAGSFARNRFNQTTNAWSIFTHNTFRVTDQVDLVFGLRWVDEDKDGKFEQFESSNQACLNALANAGALNAGASGGLEPVAATVGGIVAGFTCFPFASPAVTADSPFFGILPTEFDANFSDEELIWTLKGVYAFNDLTTAYASFTHGFKAGGFNLDATAAVGGADPRFDSETVDAWEVGLKTDLLDRQLRLNVALFYQDIEDFQVLEFTGVQFETFNVPKAESKGVELELQAAPMDQLDLRLAVTYQDASYPGNCDGNRADAPPQVSALCGGRLTNAADWTGVFGTTWEDFIPDTNLSYFANANVRWESKRRTSTQFRDPNSLVDLPYDFEGSNAKVNLRIGLGEASGRWAIEGWVNNLFDEQTRNVTFNVPLRGLGAAGTVAQGAFIEAPRTYGVTFRSRL